MDYLENRVNSALDSNHQRAFTMVSGPMLRPPHFVMANKVWSKTEIKPVNIIKKQKQYKKEKEQKEEVTSTGNFSSQKQDKKYKEIFENMDDEALNEAVRKLLITRPPPVRFIRIKHTKRETIERDRKAAQQKSYYTAEKVRSRYWKSRFDDCAKHMPPEEFLDKDYSPQMNLGLSLDSNTTDLVKSLITTFDDFGKKPISVNVDINPFKGLTDWALQLLENDFNYIMVWSALASYVKTSMRWETPSYGAITALVALTTYGYINPKVLTWFKEMYGQVYNNVFEFINQTLPEIFLTTPDPVSSIFKSRDFMSLDLNGGETSWTDNTLKPQGVLDDYQDTISDCLFSALYFRIFHTTYKSKSFSNLARDLGGFDRTQRGMGEFVTWFLQRCQKFLNWMAKVVECEVPDLISVQDADIIAYSKVVANLVNEFDEGAIVNYDFFVRLSQLKKTGEHLLADTPPSNNNRRNALRLVLNKLQPMLDKCKSNNVVHNGPRRTPLGILIGGAPGVGKSFSSIPFLHELVARIIDIASLPYFIKNPNDFILNRIWENDFWDADHAQFVIVYDDWGQSPNHVLTKQNEYMEVVRGINSTNYPLTMASLTDKGSTNYQHQLVFATTNKTHLSNCMGVSSPEAVVRRFKLAYWLAPRKEYCINPNVAIMDRRLDVSKCQGTFDENVHEFFPYDFLHGVFKSEIGISYRQFVDLAVKTYKENTDREDAALNNMRVAIERGVALRPQGIGSSVTSFVKSSGLKAFQIIKDTHFCDDSEFQPHSEVVHVDEKQLLHFCRHELANTGIDDPHLLELNRGLLAYAISKVHNLEVEDCVAIANKFSPDRDLEKWLLSNKDLIPSAVREHLRRESSILSSVMGGIKSYSKSTGKWVRENPVLSKFLAATAVLLPIATIATSLISKLYPQTSRQDWIRQKPTAAARQQYQQVRFIKQGFEEQFNDIPAVSQCLSEFSRKVINKNTYLFSLDSTRSACGSALFIKDNVAVVPFHFIDKMLELKERGYYDDEENPSAAIELRKVNSDIKYCFKPDQLDIVGTESSNSTIEDLAFVRFRNLHAHSDLTDYFVDIDNPLFKHNFNIMLAVPKETGCIQLMSKGEFGKVSYGDYSVDCCIEYRLRTSIGDCGAVCYGHNPKTSKPIIMGIHVAGSTSGHGVSYFLSKKHVDRALIQLDCEGCIDAIVPDIEPQMYVSSALPKMAVAEGSNKVQVDAVTPPRAVTVSNIIPSKVYGEWGSAITRPARLRDFVDKEGNKISPNGKAFQGYGGGFPVFNQSLMDDVVTEYISHLHNVANVPQPWEPRIWTFEEACEGIAGVEFCEGIPRQTSPGYPLCMYTKKPGKVDFFGKDGPYDFTSEACVDLRRKVDEILNHARLGIRDQHVFMTFLKDERRKLKKSEAGETRMISGTDLAFLIACRMYFGDFIRWMMSNRIRNGSAVGVNPYGEEWAILYRHLLNGDASCIDGDYASYDKTERENIHTASFKVAESYYTNSNSDDVSIRRVLSQEILNPHYLHDGKIWSAHGSMPSGSFFTTMFNTISNNLLLRYAIVGAASARDHRICTEMDYILPLSLIAKEARFIALGDDNIWSLTGKLRDLVVPAKVAAILGDLGYVYTAADKSALADQYRELKFCTFLKRGFYVSDKTVLAPLDFNTIKEMPYWTKRNAPPDNEFEVLTQALYELSLHSPDHFNSYAPKFINASIKHYGRPPPFTSHKACRARIRTMVAMY